MMIKAVVHKVSGREYELPEGWDRFTVAFKGKAPFKIPGASLTLPGTLPAELLQDIINDFINEWYAEKAK